MQESREKTDEFRLLLQRSFMQRLRERPGYSIRKFAAHLAIDPTALSKLMSGKRRMTSKMIAKLGHRLELGPEVIAAYTQKDPAKKTSARDYDHLSRDKFDVIANWYYFAILELTRLSDFRSEPQWIAAKLGLTAIEVKIAVETLTRLGLLRVGEDGRLEDHFDYLNYMPDDLSTSAHRALQRQLLGLAEQAMDEIANDRRDQKSMTFVADSRKVAEAKALVQTFIHQMTEIMQHSDATDAVYQLTVSLFPLTKN